MSMSRRDFLGRLAAVALLPKMSHAKLRPETRQRVNKELLAALESGGPQFKEAAMAINEFTRSRMRLESYFHQLLPITDICETDAC